MHSTQHNPIFNSLAGNENTEKNEEKKVSYFESSITTSKAEPTQNVAIEELLGWIEGEKFKDQIERLRNHEYGTEGYKAEKNTLPYFTPHGVFKHRKNDGLVSHSGLFCFDVDKQDNPSISFEELKAELKTKPYVYSCFDSPGGGLKFLVKVEIKDQLPDYKLVIRGLEEELEIKLDPSQGKLSQPCFVSYDPTLYLNKDSDHYFIKRSLRGIGSREKQTVASRRFNIQDPIEFAEHMLKEKGEFYQDGNKHNYIFNLACVLNRLGVLQSEAEDHIMSSYVEFGQDPTNAISSAYSNTHEFSEYEFKPQEEQLRGRAPLAKKIIREELIKGTKEEDIVNVLIDNGMPDTSQVRGLIEKIQLPKTGFIINHIKSNYKIKNNEVTGESEKNGVPMEDSDFNTIYIKVRQEVENKYGKDIPKDLIYSAIESDEFEKYHPIKNFFEEHESLDPQGVIEELAGCLVSQTGREQGHKDYVLVFLKKWLVNMIATAIDNQDNPLLLALLGGQGTGKTEFFRRLLPKGLKGAYYAEMPIIDDKDFFIAMGKHVIIMDDELSGKSKLEMTSLKKIMSKNIMDVRVPYGRKSKKIKRVSSLCGTGNDLKILNDFTGNRRIIPVEIESINHEKFNAIDKTALVMECYHLYKSGFDFRLNSHDLEMLKSSTAEFEYLHTEVELVQEWLDLPQEGDHNYKLKTSTEVSDFFLEHITKQRISNVRVGQSLRQLGFQAVSYRNGKRGTYYQIGIESKMFKYNTP